MMRLPQGRGGGVGVCPTLGLSLAFCDPRTSSRDVGCRCELMLRLFDVTACHWLAQISMAGCCWVLFSEACIFWPKEIQKMLVI
jgi:hypothetical protein